MTDAGFDIVFIDGPGPYRSNGEMKRRIALRIDDEDQDVVTLRMDSDHSRRRLAKRWSDDLGLDRQLIEEKLRKAALAAVAESQQPATEDPEGVGDASEASPQSSEKKVSQADILVQFAERCELFHSSGDDGEPFASFDAGGHRETWRVNSKQFKRWLAHEDYKYLRKAPHSQALQDAIGVIAGNALYEGPELPTAVRLAEHGGNIWLDLSDADWRAVEITPAGWRIVDSQSVPVRFIRRRGMLPIPAPVPGGSVDELRTLVNLRDDNDWRLYVAWLIAALRPTGPFPVLVVGGEQGSANSTLARFARLLLDPHLAPLRRPPKDERDVMIAASNGWIVSFDNISHVRAWLSDTLCCLATGGGFGTRELYSDDEEKLFDSQRPIILNGIEDFATRSDLADRAIRLTLPQIPDEDRRDENEDLLPAFFEARPRILGALLDAVSAALSGVAAVRLDSKPRMADFAKWATAAETALGWERGAFLAAYTGNREDGNDLVIESSPIGPSILALVADDGRWKGTAGELLAAMEGNEKNAKAIRRNDWPGNAKAMAGRLRRIAPNLRAVGIDVVLNAPRGRDKRRIIQLDRVGKQRSARSASSADMADEAPKGDSGRMIADQTEGERSADGPPENPDSGLESTSADRADHADHSIPIQSRPATPELGTVPDGWTRPRWAARLRQLATACETTDPRRAAELRAQADAVEGGE